MGHKERIAELRGAINQAAAEMAELEGESTPDELAGLMGIVLPAGYELPLGPLDEPIPQSKPMRVARGGIKYTPLPEPESIAMEAERIINGPRRDAYGPVRESFDRIATMWSAVFGCDVTAEQVAAAMVCLKVCRELGGRHHRDNGVDICGYALLWDRLANETDRPEEA